MDKEKIVEKLLNSLLKAGVSQDKAFDIACKGIAS
jgi:hypothetical protein